MRGKQYNKTYKVRPGLLRCLYSPLTSLIFDYAVVQVQRTPSEQSRRGNYFNLEEA